MSREQGNKEFDIAISRAYFKAKQLLSKYYSRPPYELIERKAREIRYELSINKELFNLTYNFTPKDYKFIRTQKYWLIRSECLYENTEGKLVPDDLKQKEYLLKCVKYYLEIINQQKQKL
jgi:hypothetical protein